jgi:hypothetical protein
MEMALELVVYGSVTRGSSTFKPPCRSEDYGWHLVTESNGLRNIYPETPVTMPVSSVPTAETE